MRQFKKKIMRHHGQPKFLCFSPYMAHNSSLNKYSFNNSNKTILNAKVTAIANMKNEMSYIK